MTENDPKAGENKATESAMTAARAAHLVGGTVRVPVINKKTGKPAVEKGVYATTDQALAAEHVTGFRVADDRVVVTTVDGRKLEGALK